MDIIKNICALLVFGFVYLQTGSVIAQKQNNIWYFGTKAGLDFNFTPPKSIVGNLITLEGTASVCDPSGQLLFYSDGVTAWDRNKNVMPNGAGLSGGNSSTQAALIVPLPNSCSKYYLFTTEDHLTDGGLAYSIIDMCLNSGLGDIVASKKNIQLQNQTAEKLTTILHSNGTDIWIVTHKLNSREFLAYSLSATGLNTTPVVSSVGSFYDGNAFIGPAKASHDGTKIVSSASFYNICEMFDFNRNTGKLSNVYDLNQIFSGQQWVYGVEFSPNDSLLYLSTFWQTNFLYQVVLKNKVLTTLRQLPGKYRFGMLQMGPDEKIYMARNDSTFLDVIEKPNIPGNACQYKPRGQLLATGSSSLAGLPNFTPYSFYQPVITVFSLGQDTTLCNGDTLLINLSSVSDCPVTYLWNDGSTVNTKVINQTGTYWVEANYACFKYRDTIQIDAPPAPDVSFNDTTLCQGQHAIFNAAVPGADYLWSDNSTHSSLETDKEGSYWVRLSSSCYTVTDSFEIEVVPRPLVSFVDTSLCDGDLLLLDATFPDVDYLWSDSGTDAFLQVEKAGSYWVRLTNTCFAIYDTITITTISSPDIDLVDTVICDGYSITLDASLPGAAYMWSDGSTLPFLVIDQEGTYSVNISNKCGQELETITVQGIDCDFSIYMPNVFTPNDDGTNDGIKPFISDPLSAYLFEIFDRWGDCVFKSHDAQESWDGFFKNKKMMPGVYAFYVECTSTLGIRKKLKGDITLIR